ncbi:MAG: FecR domain-containing protein [Rhizobium sp.]|nr:FecR domain-containing protein [Rhizobium sp.]MCZ8352577.1 FecR domain-containing protein [Rhizobium sp.]
MHVLTDQEDEAGYRHPDPVTDQALEWVLRLKAREADSTALNAWLAEGADRGEALARVLALYDCPELTVATAQTMPTEKPPIPASPRPTATSWRLSPVALAVAASLAVALMVPLLVSGWFLGKRADYRTAAGEIVTIDLPDGSRLQMNSQTAVTVDFEDGRRAVSLLQGEAFFEVAHDSTRPFTVTGGFGIVKVTGTAFNVAREAAADVVHLQSGRVMLTRDDTQSSPVALSPGQTAAVDHSRISFLPAEDGETRLAWREGWIQLSAEPLRAALEEIGRHTDLTIVTLPTAVLDTPVSGSFRIAEAGAAIESVVTAAGARIEHLPGGVIFIH